MTPVMQDIFYTEHSRGNCWAAIIASLIDLPLEDVPHFVQIDVDGGMDWLEHTQQFLAEHGVALNSMVNTEWTPDEPYIQCGLSPRSPAADGSTILHAVIYRNGELLHDPYPNGGGLVSVGAAYRLVKRAL